MSEPVPSSSTDHLANLVSTRAGRLSACSDSLARPHSAFTVPLVERGSDAESSRPGLLGQRTHLQRDSAPTSRAASRAPPPCQHDLRPLSGAPASSSSVQIVDSPEPLHRCLPSSLEMRPRALGTQPSVLSPRAQQMSLAEQLRAVRRMSNSGRRRSIGGTEPSSSGRRHSMRGPEQTRKRLRSKSPDPFRRLPPPPEPSDLVGGGGGGGGGGLEGSAERAAAGDGRGAARGGWCRAHRRLAPAGRCRQAGVGAAAGAR